MKMQPPVGSIIPPVNKANTPLDSMTASSPENSFLNRVDVLANVSLIPSTLTILFACIIISADEAASSSLHTNAVWFGAIIAYFGVEVRSDAFFERLLWPTRYYNTWNPEALRQIMLLTPMGGPLLAPAVRAIDEFMHSGLLLGNGRGDMLGTAFFRDIGQKFKIYASKGDKDVERPNEYEKMRNMLWVRVLRLANVHTTSNSSADTGSATKATKGVSAKRIVYHLTLESTPGKEVAQSDQTKIPAVGGDVGNIHLRNVVGVVCSEILAMAIGVFVAVGHKSLFALLFFIPFMLKTVSLLFPIRRRPLQNPASTADLKDKYLYELSREHDNDDFMLIEGPSHLLYQFCRHYGHPSRTNPGIWTSDRTREVISICLATAFALLFPIGLVVSVWADEKIQWIWLSYEAYATLAMYVFRFFGGAMVGTTEEELAKGLEKGNKVALLDEEGKGVIASLKTWVVGDVAGGVEKMNELVKDWE